MKRSLSVILFTVLINFFILFLFPGSGSARAEDIFKITVLDVGKGDCILVESGSSAEPDTVMIDTGYDSLSGDILSYLSGHNITKLDALIISHYHKDHVGGAAAILKGIPVGKVYMPDYEGTRKVYTNMMDLLPGASSTRTWRARLWTNILLPSSRVVATRSASTRFLLPMLPLPVSTDPKKNRVGESVLFLPNGMCTTKTLKASSPSPL